MRFVMKRTRRIAAAVLIGSGITACGRDDAREPVMRVEIPIRSEEAKQTVDRAAAAIDDATVTAKVKAALIAAPRVKGLAIDVATSQNVVTLSGSVDSETMRTDAQRVATSIEGVKEVRNNLTVKNM